MVTHPNEGTQTRSTGFSSQLTTLQRLPSISGRGGRKILSNEGAGNPSRIINVSSIDSDSRDGKLAKMKTLRAKTTS